MVPKQDVGTSMIYRRFRAVLFRMVPKHLLGIKDGEQGFRAVLFRMVPKLFIFESAVVKMF